MSFATVKSSFEARCLVVMLAVLVALAVPASAAAFGAAPSLPAQPAADVPAQAASTPWVENAPSPLMVLLLGALIVGATVTRRVRKSALRMAAEAASSPGRGSPIAAR